MIKKINKRKKYQIYIGMKDKEKLEQLCPTEDFIKIISSICSNYKIGFSMEEIYGGYISSKGKFISENSLVISIIGLNKKEILELSKELKDKLNQETIMISIEKTKTIFIN